MIKPCSLRPGDRVALIAPSSPVTKKNGDIARIHQIHRRIRYLFKLFMKDGYLSGTDKARAKDVNKAFTDRI